jgi:hypothetical protein
MFDKQISRSGVEYWWDNCSRDCGCTDPNVFNGTCQKLIGKDELPCTGKCARGSANRIQKENYALQVLFHMKLWDGKSQFAICPLTGQEFDLACGEVDKVYENRRYTEGNIVYVSLKGNQERAKLQLHYDDLKGLARYASDVAMASHNASVMRKTHCKAMPWPKRGRNNYATVRPDERPASDMSSVRFGPYGRP